jgi:DNA-binding HxlR family transcriptional regulator
MTGRRTYRDSCGIARALDTVGERWALLVARELLTGPKRFSDLRAGLPKIAPDVLSQRLRELEQAGVVGRRTLPPPAASRIYELTEWGRELEPVLLALGRWGSRAPLPLGGPALSVAAAIVALETTFHPADGADVGDIYELRLDGQPFTLRVRGDHLEATPGPAANPTASFATNTATLAALLWHGGPAEGAIAAGTLTVDGDPDAFHRFAAWFAAPVPAFDLRPH